MTSAVTPRAHWDDWGKLLLRVTLAGNLLMHGLAKLGGIGWMADRLGAFGLPAFIGYGVYVGEIVAPLLIIAGKFTRLAGLVVAFNMLMAIVLVQSSKVFTRTQSGAWGIELEALFLVGGIVLFLLGSGRYAVSKGTGRWD